MPPKAKPSNFTRKDYVTLIISITALAISLFAFYYNNIRVSDRMSVKILDLDLKRDTSKGVDGDTAIIKVAFFNSGNRQSIILTPSYQMSDTINTNNQVLHYGDIDNDNQFPIILEPNQVKIVNLKLGYYWVNFNHGKLKETWASGTSFYLTYCRFKFSAIDSKGMTHSKYGDYEIYLGTDAMGFREVGPSYYKKNVSPFKKIDIF